MEDVNWAPWSEVKRAGRPKPEIQVEIKAGGKDSAVMEVNGVAFRPKGCVVNHRWNIGLAGG